MVEKYEVDEKCPNCKLVFKIFPEILTDFDYYLMTEVFVKVHDGKDYCDYESKKVEDGK